MFLPGSGPNNIWDFRIADDDLLDLSIIGVTSFDELFFTDYGDSVFIDFGEASDVDGVTPSNFEDPIELSADDFIFAIA